MKKKLLLITFFYMLSLSSLIGQPDVTLLQEKENISSYWLNTVPFYDLPKIKIGKYYNNKLEIKIPKDTIMSINDKISKVHVKTVNILGIEGVPNGLSYSHSIVEHKNEKFIHFYLELYGRALVKPTSGIRADMSVTFTLNNGRSLVRSFEIKNILLREDRTKNLETAESSIGLKSLKSYPNPLNNKTEVSFWSSKLQLVEFEVRDALGNLKYKQTFTAKVGSNKVSFSQKDLPNGLYLYSIKNQDITLAKRLIVK
jgi:hypothetical protein